MNFSKNLIISIFMVSALNIKANSIERFCKYAKKQAGLSKVALLYEGKIMTKVKVDDNLVEKETLFNGCRHDIAWMTEERFFSFSTPQYLERTYRETSYNSSNAPQSIRHKRQSLFSLLYNRHETV